MKILQLLESAATGAGRHVVDLTEGLLARGHEVHLVYSPLRCDQMFTAGLERLRTNRNFHSLPLPIQRHPSPGDLPVIGKLRRYLRTRGPFDLVHCHSTKAGLIGRAGLIGHSVKRLYTPHGFMSMDPRPGRMTARIAGGLEKVLAKCACRRGGCLARRVCARRRNRNPAKLNCASFRTGLFRHRWRRRKPAIQLPPRLGADARTRSASGLSGVLLR